MDWVLTYWLSGQVEVWKLPLFKAAVDFDETKAKVRVSNGVNTLYEYT